MNYSYQSWRVDDKPNKANKALFSSESKCLIDESKLSLAVYTPEVEPEVKKPVMVWIHGGGWQFGSAESYNGAALAKYGDVVVVLLSYRSRVSQTRIRPPFAKFRPSEYV